MNDEQLQTKHTLAVHGYSITVYTKDNTMV